MWTITTLARELDARKRLALALKRLAWALQFLAAALKHLASVLKALAVSAGPMLAETAEVILSLSVARWLILFLIALTVSVYKSGIWR